MANNPSSPKLELADKQAEKLRWDKADKDRTSAAYRAYLDAHPSGPHAHEATVAVDHATWGEAKDRKGYETYLLSHSQGQHAKDAKNALENLDWVEAEQANSADSYGQYILHNAKGKYAEEARSRREDLVWEEVTAKDTVHSYRKYLMRHLKGRYRDDAQARIEEMTFSRANVVVRARSTWRGDGKALANNLVREVKATYFKDLVLLGYSKKMQVIGVDATSGEPPHPLDVYPVSPGTALINVDLDETRGERMTPAYATNIKATVSIYAAGRREPLTTKWVDARTSPYVVRTSQALMYADAEMRLGHMLIRSVRAEDYLKPRSADDKDDGGWGDGGEGDYGPRLIEMDDPNSLSRRLGK